MPLAWGPAWCQHSLCTAEVQVRSLQTQFQAWGSNRSHGDEFMKNM